jgi:hypothetical protein
MTEPQPLKGKMFTEAYGKVNGFRDYNVASAVEWLKKRIMDEDSLPYCAECDSLMDLFGVIDEAFSDVVVKK